MSDRAGSLVRKMWTEAEDDSETFWTREASKVNWFERWSSVLAWTPPTFRWFDGGKTNLSYNCLDLQVEKGRGSHRALIAENERGETEARTYSQLLADVERLAAALRGIGVKKGDRVAIYMPTIPEAVAAMLATTRIGAVHIVVFAGFGSEALSERIALAGAKVLLTADATWRKGKEVRLWPIVEGALGAAGSPVEHVVVLSRGLR